MVLKNGLSRMRGDSHVRFLGGGGAAMRRRYPTAFAPAALRAALGAPGYRRTVDAGSAWPAPRRDGRGAGEHAGACCGRLCKCVPSSTLAVPACHVTKDGSRTTRPASLWSFHATPQDRHRKVRQGRSHLSSGG